MYASEFEHSWGTGVDKVTSMSLSVFVRKNVDP
jgi:hypothetical protein